MEGFIALASFSLAYAFIVLLGLILLLNILGLPANWVVVLLVVLWKFLHPAAGALDVWFWIMFLGLAVLGEVLEMGVQVMTSSPISPSGTGSPVLGSTISGRYASSQTCRPFWFWHSKATPGPFISERP